MASSYIRNEEQKVTLRKLLFFKQYILATYLQFRVDLLTENRGLHTIFTGVEQNK